MKSHLITLSLWVGLIFIPIQSLHADISDPARFDWKKVPTQPASIEVRPNYDENEPVRIELTEYFPNLCYRPAPVESQVDIENRRIILNDFAFLFTDGICPMVVEPTQRTVELGQLPAGDWELWVTGEQGKDKAGDFRVK